MGCSTTLNEKNQNETAHINVKLGLLYLQVGRIEIAKSKLLFAYKKAPYDPEVHAALGNFFSQTGEFNIAAKYYLWAIKLAPEKGPFWHNYGKFLYHTGHYQQALDYFLLAAQDINYLFVGAAYADAGKAAWKLQQNNLAKYYHAKAIATGL